MKRIALSLLLAAGAALPALPAAAAELIMRNATPERLTLFVNNTEACTAAPGQDCTAQVEQGPVNLRATGPDGKSVYDRLTVQDATMIWTVRYYQPTSSGPGEAPPAQ